MKVGFLTNHISYGGTEVALYDYAHFNETLLGNTSIVLTRDFRDTHGDIYAKFETRFPLVYVSSQADIDDAVTTLGLDVLYVIKSGERDAWFTTKCKTIVHCVFTTKFPHGTVYCAISDTLNRLHGTRVPVLPHMISVAEHSESFRAELGIPATATVIGRYGSTDSFDIPFVHQAIVEYLNATPTAYFVAMNTKEFARHPRILYLPRTTDAHVKRRFINTCDGMLHARSRGETFGLSCGEFAVCGKPILTYAGSPERAHIDILGPACTLYSSKEDLLRVLTSGSWKKDMTANGYLQYTPDRVMKTFASMLSSIDTAHTVEPPRLEPLRALVYRFGVHRG